jgi:uncharacterized protein YeaO (DUF488 family)
MPVRTKRWNDPASPDDGHRLLICRYRPRGVPSSLARGTARFDSASEPWDGWCLALAPSKDLHAAVYGKRGPAIDFAEYERRFRAEMELRGSWISAFAERVRKGDTITLLCSSACVDEARCHRTIVKALIEQAAAEEPAAPPARTAPRQSRT